MLDVRKERRSFASGPSQVVLIRTGRLRPSRLAAPARVRARELAHILAKRFERPVTAVALPPASLRAAGWAGPERLRTGPETLLSLRSLVASAIGTPRGPADGGLSGARHAHAGLLAALQRRGLAAVASHHGGEGERLMVPVGGLGFPRVAGGLMPESVLVNTHFFVLEPVELDSPHTAIGDPVGMLARAGVVLRPPAVGRAVLVETGTGWSVRQLGPEDVELRLGSDGSLPAGQVRLLGRGAAAPGRDAGLEACLQGRWAMAVSEEGGMAVPHGGLLARWEGSPTDAVRRALQRAEPVSYRIPSLPDLITAVQAGPELLRSGEVVVSEEQLEREGLPSPAAGAVSAPLAFPTDVDRTPAARVGIGVTVDGGLVVAVVEGASSVARTSASDSRGCTLTELAELLRGAGAVDALNLDGGGSAQAFLGSGALMVPADTRRSAGATFDRPVPVVACLG